MKRLLCLMLIFMALGAFAQKSNLFVGTYTDTIYVYSFDRSNGSLSQISATSGIKSPSYLTLSKNQDMLYAVSERGNGNIVAYSVREGVLTRQSATSAMGDDPCYIDMHGNVLATGNYTSGNFVVMSVNSDGSLPPVKQSVKHVGKSVNPKRQEKPHVHSTRFSKDGKSLWVADLGTDKLYIYPVVDGKVNEKKMAVTAVKGGSGPRHFDFHPNKNIVYLLNEMSGAINVYKYSSNKLTQIQEVKSYLESQDDVVGVGSADIHITPNGKYLYASHRGVSNMITIYRVESNGTLIDVGSHSSMGVNPRNFTISPDGLFLIVANGQSNNIAVLSINPKTGLLKPTGFEIKVAKPAFVCF